MSASTRTIASRNRPIRVLALDGGGVRGLSSLLILRELMERLAARIGITKLSSIRPCDYFDLIIGTGTGGISALFLGRLRMTATEAIEEYVRMADTAFKPSPIRLWRFWGSNVPLDGNVLERAVGDIVQERLHDREAHLEDTSEKTTLCRTAVLASTNANADTPPYVFRSYTTNYPASRLAIYQVGRATVSTAGLFTPVSLGNPPVQFIDAALAGYNNPTEVGLAEAAALWPGREVDCLVSLGTGLQKIVRVGQGWAGVAHACSGITHSCEQVHDRIFHLRQHNGLSYFRFNVDRGLDEVDIMEWSEAGPRGNLSAITDSYIRWAEVSDRLDTVVRVLSGEKFAIQRPLVLIRMDAANVPSMRSQYSRMTMVLRFINMRTDPVHLHWIDFNGRRVLFAPIFPGQVLPIDTYTTHPWVITDAASGSALGIWNSETTCVRAVLKDGTKKLEPKPHTVDLTPIDAAKEFSLRSQNSGKPTIITFINMRTEPVHLYWLEANGKRVSYGIIAPGSMREQPTCVAHPWVVIDDASGEVLGIWNPEELTAQAVIQ